MASFIVGPLDVHPDLTGMFADGVAVTDVAESLRLALSLELAEVGLRHNIIDGSVALGGEPTSTSTTPFSGFPTRLPRAPLRAIRRDPRRQWVGLCGQIRGRRTTLHRRVRLTSARTREKIRKWLMLRMWLMGDLRPTCGRSPPLLSRRTVSRRSNPRRRPRRSDGCGRCPSLR